MTPMTALIVLAVTAAMVAVLVGGFVALLGSRIWSAVSIITGSLTAAIVVWAHFGGGAAENKGGGIPAKLAVTAPLHQGDGLVTIGPLAIAVAACACIAIAALSMAIVLWSNRHCMIQLLQFHDAALRYTGDNTRKIINAARPAGFTRTSERVMSQARALMERSARGG